jgi:hypothetical protein
MSEQGVAHFFRGKEGSNNQRILTLLLSQEPLTHWTIAKRIDRPYSTVWGRVTTLSEDGLLEKKTERPGAKNKQPVPLWGLTAYGLCVLAMRGETLAIEKCARAITDHWKKFNQIYKLDKIRPRLLYDAITEWLKTNEGILQLLRTFGAWPLSGESAALSTFRRMIDLALLYRHGEWLPIVQAVQEQPSSDKPAQFTSQFAYRLLGEIATRHREFGRLETVLQEVDGPFIEYLVECARKELVQKLREPLGEAVAQKLGMTPLFKDENRWHTTGAEADNLLKSISSTITFGAEIYVGHDRVDIITPYPDMISEEWKQHCAVHPLSTGGEHKAKKMAKNRSARSTA